MKPEHTFAELELLSNVTLAALQHNRGFVSSRRVDNGKASAHVVFLSSGFDVVPALFLLALLKLKSFVFGSAFLPGQFLFDSVRTVTGAVFDAVSSVLELVRLEAAVGFSVAAAHVTE